MGLIDRVLTLVFGGGRTDLTEIAGIFRVLSENEAEREAAYAEAALAQFAAEFARPPRGRFDRAVDAINRLPRPLMALGCLGLIGSALVDPAWFAERMAGLLYVPEPLWWLMGAVVSFYFGARHQVKRQDFQRSLASMIAAAAAGAATGTEERGATNPALAEWRGRHDG